MSYTVQEAARELGISVRTLMRWCERLRIPLDEDPLDRRRRVLSRSDLERLRQHYVRSAVEEPSSSTGSGTEEIQRSLDTIQGSINSLTSQMSSLQNSVVSLHSWIAAAMDTLASLMARVTELEQQNRGQDQSVNLPARANKGGGGGKEPGSVALPKQKE